jgi:hypothetical protein
MTIPIETYSPKNNIENDIKEQVIILEEKKKSKFESFYDNIYDIFSNLITGSFYRLKCIFFI